MADYTTTNFPDTAIAETVAESLGDREKLEDLEMARRCELTGKAVMTGNNVSHANNKSRRRFLPNLSNATLLSDALKRSVRLRVTASALRSVEHRGGLDQFLMKARDEDLSDRAAALKRDVVKALAAS